MADGRIFHVGMYCRKPYFFACHGGGGQCVREDFAKLGVFWKRLDMIECCDTRQILRKLTGLDNPPARIQRDC
jgi:hypothetical protein